MITVLPNNGAHILEDKKYCTTTTLQKSDSHSDGVDNHIYGD